MKTTLLISTSALVMLAGVALAQGDHDHAINQEGAILSEEDAAKVASFDILAAHAHRKGNVVTFHMTTAGAAGATVWVKTKHLRQLL